MIFFFFLLINVIFPLSQVKETGDIAIAGGYVDITSAIDKPFDREPLKVGGSNRSLDF